jgi:hypothetical protein
MTRLLLSQEEESRVERESTDALIEGVPLVGCVMAADPPVSEPPLLGAGRGHGDRSAEGGCRECARGECAVFRARAGHPHDDGRS